MSRKEQIRNLGIIAHIDHGKTTLTDSLLAGAGLISTKMEGSVRVLDYLEEEQKRGITIKTANITLPYKAADDTFIINLVDTPGHVDFTGKVTRALRAIDGAVVVVDAVEEIMAQTETVTRQALEERVRPLLFINKVDRLINELKLSAEQIQKKFMRIISNFNDLIEVYGESPFKDEWKVEAAKDNVAFGSALHRWGFTISIARQKNLKFTDIVSAYKHTDQQKLQKTIPLHTAILEMTIRHIPNPLEAQKYRIEKIWRGNMSSAQGQAMSNCDDNGATVMCITNVQSYPDEGLVATGRLFSGTLKNGDRVHLINTCTEGVVKRVSVFMGAFREELSQAMAGNIIAVSGLAKVEAGETLVDVMHAVGMVPFERVRYVSEPVLVVAVEPRNPVDLPFLLEALAKLHVEDPNIDVEVNRETGEYLLSGMGELHLEIALKRLSECAKGIQIEVSQPRVVYSESVTKKSMLATALSPNRQNRFVVQVEHLSEEISKIILESAELKIAGKVVAVDEQRKNILIDCTGEGVQASKLIVAVTSGFEYACKAGPLCGEPLRHVKVNLMKMQLSEKSEYCSPVEVMRGVGKAIFGAVLSAQPVLLEPVYKIVFSVPTELAGECQRILSGRRGKLAGFEQKGLFTVITAYVPVAETFGLAAELRSATSGRAFWQSTLNCWQKVPEKLALKVVEEVRQRKGLPLTVPKPEQFLEAA
ncbi:MAG: GTP-binding protein [Candidatus Bathyarchaeia archaeon]